MPTRLEVRYLSGASGPELAIRVVPDDIGVHSFEPELTAEEVAEGTIYWTAVTAGNVDDEARSAAWVTILSRLGAARAAWTVETMRPIGPPMAGGPQLPDVPTKESTWTRAANCLVLPDRFTFRGWRGGQLVFEVTGKDVPDDLTLGPDPTALQGARPDLPDGQPTLAWSGSSSWMINFEDAVDVGLGVRIPLAGTDLSFDEIFAVGISDRSPADAQARLATTLPRPPVHQRAGVPDSGRANEQHGGDEVGLDDSTDDADARGGRGCPCRRTARRRPARRPSGRRDRVAGQRVA